MLSKIDTKKKLLLFPIIFLIIVILSGVVYSYWSNISNKRSDAAVKTEEFTQQVLKGRISVYQFLRSPNDKTAKKVKEDFELLNKDVLQFKSTLSLERNKILSDEIVSNSKKYIDFFDAFSNQRIKDFENGIKEESVEIKNIISQMVQVGLVLEAKLDEILRVETRLLKNTANVNGSKGLLQTIQAWSDSKNGVCLSERGELVYDGTQSIEPAQDIIINNLPSEPDWSTAPEWAQWFGINANGTAFWCNQKPFLQQYLYPDVWLVPKFSKFMTAQGLYDASNWVDAIFERPQAEAEQVTITAQLDTDIDGYLADKKSCISAYVDLLLARMAKEERCIEL